jgi:hypothetical protein
MSPATAPLLGVCPEYQRLLQSCQKALAVWQQRRTRVERGPLAAARARANFKRLQSDYARMCTQLESHEQFCQHCQYVSKVGGLDFESMASALNRHGFS